jgi:hypothetical protein
MWDHATCFTGDGMDKVRIEVSKCKEYLWKLCLPSWDTLIGAIKIAWNYDVIIMHDIIIYYCGKLSRIKGNKKVKKLHCLKVKRQRGKSKRGRTSRKRGMWNWSSGLLHIVSGVQLNFSSKLAVMSRLWTHHGLQIMDQLFKSNLTFCVVCVFTLQIYEWCVHNRLFNANFEEKF